jgi:hypothetical protein
MLLSDWADINFVIGTNPEDFIEIKFDVASIDSARGLHAYMNTLLTGNDMMVKHCLRRVAHYWGWKDEGESRYLYYMLAPPWVKVLVNDTLNSSAVVRARGNISDRKDSESFRFALA